MNDGAACGQNGFIREQMVAGGLAGEGHKSVEIARESQRESAARKFALAVASTPAAIR